MKSRYTINQEGFGDLFYADKFEQAVGLAENMLKTGENKPVQIHDKMARKTKPRFYNVSICKGEAHSNPFIDHCWVCMPRWGIVVKPVPLTPPPLLDGERNERQ